MQKQHSAHSFLNTLHEFNPNKFWQPVIEAIATFDPTQDCANPMTNYFQCWSEMITSGDCEHCSTASTLCFCKPAAMFLPILCAFLKNQSVNVN